MRPRVPAAIAAAVILAADATFAAVLWPQVAGVNDYVGLVAGGKALLAGRHPYDAATWSAFATAVGQRPDTAVFGYPPWVALAFVPLATLPTLVGSVVWTVGGMTCAFAAMLALARRWRWPQIPGAALALASWPALLVLVQGQWGFVLLALSVALLLDLESGRDARAGIWWALLVLAKPQLVVLGSAVLAAWLVRARRPRALLVAGASVALAVAAGTLAAPGWFGPYVSIVVPLRASRSVQQPTLAGLAGDIAGGLWPLAWVALVGVLAYLVLRSVALAPRQARVPLGFTAVLALSVAAAPYSWSYDHYLAVPLGAATIAVAASRPRGLRLAIVAGVAVLFGPLAFALFESAYVRWHDTLAALVPVLAIVLARAAVGRPASPAA